MSYSRLSVDVLSVPGGILRIQSEGDDQSKDRKKIPTKLKKKSLDKKLTKQSIPNFRT